jgi:hypothetical protein
VAEADRELRHRLDTAMPSSEQCDPQQGQPAGRRGQRHPEHRQPDDQQQHHGDDGDDEDLHHLAEEVRRARHRRPGQRLERAVGALPGDVDRQVLQARAQHAGRDHPGEEVAGEAHPRPEVVVQHRAEHEQQADREEQGEDDGLALPGELLELDGDAGGVRAGQRPRGRGAGRGGGGHAGSPISFR